MGTSGRPTPKVSRAGSRASTGCRVRGAVCRAPLGEARGQVDGHDAPDSGLPRAAFHGEGPGDQARVPTGWPGCARGSWGRPWAASGAKCGPGWWSEHSREARGPRRCRVDLRADGQTATKPGPRPSLQSRTPTSPWAASPSTPQDVNVFPQNQMHPPSGSQVGVTPLPLWTRSPGETRETGPLHGPAPCPAS